VNNKEKYYLVKLAFNPNDPNNWDLGDRIVDDKGHWDKKTGKLIPPGKNGGLSPKPPEAAPKHEFKKLNPLPGEFNLGNGKTSPPVGDAPGYSKGIPKGLPPKSPSPPEEYPIPKHYSPGGGGKARPSPTGWGKGNNWLQEQKKNWVPLKYKEASGSGSAPSAPLSPFEQARQKAKRLSTDNFNKQRNQRHLAVHGKTKAQADADAANRTRAEQDFRNRKIQGEREHQQQGQQLRQQQSQQQANQSLNTFKRTHNL